MDFRLKRCTRIAKYLHRVSSNRVFQTTRDIATPVHCALKHELNLEFIEFVEIIEWPFVQGYSLVSKFYVRYDRE